MFDLKAGKLKIGDYFYANNQFSHERIDDGDVGCLGQVFAIDQINKCVWAVSLIDQSFAWKDNGEDKLAGNLNLDIIVGQDLASLFEDLSYEFYAQGVRDKQEYEALYRASHVDLLPQGCSSYLPTGGQWKLILENLCGVNIRSNAPWICTQQNEIGLNGTYWVSTVFDNKKVYTVDVSDIAVFRCEDEVGQTYNMRYVIKIGE